MPDTPHTIGPGSTVLPIRIVVDVNVWVAHILSLKYRRKGTSAQQIVAITQSMTMGSRPAQLVVSHEMIDTLLRVLARKQVSSDSARELVSAIWETMVFGPERLNPILLLSGRDQIALKDREDAGVLATAIAAKADLLITENIRDFKTHDCEVIVTSLRQARSGQEKLFAIVHERADEVSLTVAHPLDVLEWVRRGLDLTPASIRRAYQQAYNHES